jgi:hypothetical protein
MSLTVGLNLLVAPDHCEYVGGPCDQGMPTPAAKRAFLVYPSAPENVSTTIESAVEKLKTRRSDWEWVTWRGLPIVGQVIFCQICKSMRSSAVVIADVTTLNFNVLFEIGYALGLGLAVMPIRDTSISTDRRDFESLGLLDTLGYLDFTNSDQLADGVLKRIDNVVPLPNSPARVHTETPLYVIKGPIETDGALELLGSIAKAGLRFRAFDPRETQRLPLFEALRQVASSVGMIGNLLDPARDGSRVHNARTALVAGLSMAQQKVVSLFQETEVVHPIDYRDVISSYSNTSQLRLLLEPTFRRVIQAMQEPSAMARPGSTPILQQLDLGDVAAENEITGLRSYFVTTGQATQARQGHARLVVGRKGAGKTAVFYDVLRSRPRGNDSLVIDLKPEGHQFAELRDFTTQHMAVGVQEHTMVAFWHYILLCELARAAIEEDHLIARVDPGRFKAYEQLRSVYAQHDPGWEMDFSQRLIRQVQRITRELGDVPTDQLGGRLTEIIYSGDVRNLNNAVAEYLHSKDSVWMLIDNLDKGWPIRGTTDADIVIVRSLLEATRKIQRQLENEVQFDCLVFLRSDIYEHLRIQTPDKGKDTAIRLDWEDREMFQEIVRRRVESSTELRGSFRDIWAKICDPLVHAQDSFAYITDRTLMRPRDLLQFLHGAVDVAINRGHVRIEEDDLLTAEKSYSEDLLLATAFEIADTRPDLKDVLYGFQGAPSLIPLDEIYDRLVQTGVAQKSCDEVVDLLFWFGFLGVSARDFPEPKYAYNVQSNLRRLTFPLSQGDGMLVVHPAFCAALDVENDGR